MRATTAKAVFLVSVAALGAVCGTALSPAAVTAKSCEYNVCFVDVGNCGMTDLSANCSETLPPPHCQSSRCDME